MRCYPCSYRYMLFGMELCQIHERTQGVIQQRCKDFKEHKNDNGQSAKGNEFLQGKEGR